MNDLVIKNEIQLLGPIGSIEAYISIVNQAPVLTKEEEQQLFQQMKRGRKRARAREKLIRSNLRLVVKIANQYRGIGLDFPDLINEGNIGLMTAVDKFSLDKGAKLSYYASFWIKQCIRRAISNKGRTIRLPVATVDAKLKVHKYIDNFELKNQRVPTETEISEGTNIPLKKVGALLKLNFQSESLNVKVSEGEGLAELGNLLKNENALSPYAIFANKSENEVLNKFLDSLGERERYIITRRFGLDGSKPQTLEVIGKKFNLTRERIRQLELAALKTLREMYKKINKNKVHE